MAFLRIAILRLQIFVRAFIRIALLCLASGYMKIGSHFFFNANICKSKH